MVKEKAPLKTEPKEQVKESDTENVKEDDLDPFDLSKEFEVSDELAGSEETGGKDGDEIDIPKEFLEEEEENFVK